MLGHEEEEEEEKKFWEKQKKIAIAYLKESIKERVSEKDNWRGKLVILDGNLSVIEEILWVVKLSAKARGVEVIDVRDNDEQERAIINKVFEADRSLDNSKREEFRNKVIMLTTKNLTKEEMNRLGYLIPRSHIPGLFIVIENERGWAGDSSIHFYLK